MRLRRLFGRRRAAHNGRTPAPGGPIFDIPYKSMVTAARPLRKGREGGPREGQIRGRDPSGAAWGAGGSLGVNAWVLVTTRSTRASAGSIR